MWLKNENYIVNCLKLPLNLNNLILKAMPLLELYTSRDGYVELRQDLREERSLNTH